MRSVSIQCIHALNLRIGSLRESLYLQLSDSGEIVDSAAGAAPYTDKEPQSSKTRIIRSDPKEYTGLKRIDTIHYSGIDYNEGDMGVYLFW